MVHSNSSKRSGIRDSQWDLQYDLVLLLVEIFYQHDPPKTNIVHSDSSKRSGIRD